MHSMTRNVDRRMGWHSHPGTDATSRLRKRFLVLGSLLLGAFSASAFPATGPATAGFQKLQVLVGDWQGRDQNGHVVKTSFKLIVSGTAVMETLTAAGMDEMVTLYSFDGDAIVLLHYCPTNNQPRMRAVPPQGDAKELVFSFEAAGNLPSPEAGHEHKLVIQFEDKDHITEHWTWRQNGKDTEMSYHFARKKGS